MKFTEIDMLIHQNKVKNFLHRKTFALLRCQLVSVNHLILSLVTSRIISFQIIGYLFY